MNSPFRAFPERRPKRQASDRSSTWPRFTAHFVLCVSLASLGACGPTPPSQAPKTDALEQRLERATARKQAGGLAYRGQVFIAGAAEPAFTYERHVEDVSPPGVASTSVPSVLETTPALKRTSHTTYDASGSVVVLQSATHTPDFQLTRFDQIHTQLDSVATVWVDGDTVHFTLQQGDNIDTATETVSEPVVVGPTLYGFIEEHWDQLLAEESLAIRFAVVERLETVGFDVELTQRDATHVVFDVSPTSFLIAWFVDPLRVTYDVKTRQVVRYQGIVPQKARRDGEWHDLIGSVRYTHFAAPGQGQPPRVD